MTPVWLAFAVGMFLGAFIGVVAMAIIIAGRRQS